MKRLGTVLVFKEGTSKKQALEALRKIEDLLEVSSHPMFDLQSKIREFDDNNGGPVWYIP
jgi:hypothetical protein